MTGIKKKPSRQFLIFASIAVGLIVAGTAMLLLWPVFLATDVIAAGISVNEMPVGGLHIVEARTVLEQQYRDAGPHMLELEIAGERLAISLHELGIAPDIEATLNSALALGRSGGWRQQLKDRERLKSEGHDLPWVWPAQSQSLRRYLSDLADRVAVPAIDGQLALGEHDQIIAIEDRSGRKLDVDQATKLIFQALNMRRNQAVHLPLDTIVPRTVASFRDRGISDVLTVYSTIFDPADQGRTTNLRLAAQALSGFILEPGAVFSFNKVVGPRDVGRGYREAPIIVDDELVPGIGGGICQVSSTLYNAVLLAALTPVERLNHSLAPAYVQAGRDATVAYGLIDFKFKNTRPEPIMIGSRVDHNKLSIAIFGTKRNERVEIRTEVMEIIPFSILHVNDDNLAPGEEQIKQQGRPGYKVRVIRLISHDDQLVRQETMSYDTYQPTAEIHLLGPDRGDASSVDDEPLEPWPDVETESVEELVSEPEPEPEPVSDPPAQPEQEGSVNIYD